MKRKKKQADNLEETIEREWRIITHLKTKDENHMLFMAYVIVLTAIVIINTTFVLNRAPANQTAQANAAQMPSLNNILTSQQSAESSTYNVSITNVTETDKPDPAFTIASDETMLIMEISITNNTTENQNFLPDTQLYVRAADGTYSTMHPSIYVTKPIQSGEISPGQNVNGQISFDVPKSLTHPLLYVDLGWNNTVPVVFDALH
jgi:hypothetical protein